MTTVKSNAVLISIGMELLASGVPTQERDRRAVIIREVLDSRKLKRLSEVPEDSTAEFVAALRVAFIKADPVLRTLSIHDVV